MTLDNEGKIDNELVINHVVQIQLDRLEQLINDKPKTWIPIAEK